MDLRFGAHRSDPWPRMIDSWKIPGCPGRDSPRGTNSFNYPGFYEWLLKLFENHRGIILYIEDWCRFFFEILARCRTTQGKVSCWKDNIDIFRSQLSSHGAVRKIGFYSNLIATQKYTSSQKNGRLNQGVDALRGWFMEPIWTFFLHGILWSSWCATSVPWAKPMRCSRGNVFACTGNM